jgi:hypothetical protein
VEQSGQTEAAIAVAVDGPAEEAEEVVAAVAPAAEAVVVSAAADTAEAGTRRQMNDGETGVPPA